MIRIRTFDSRCYDVTVGNAKLVEPFLTLRFTILVLVAEAVMILKRI